MGSVWFTSPAFCSTETEPMPPQRTVESEDRDHLAVDELRRAARVALRVVLAVARDDVDRPPAMPPWALM